LVARGSAVNPGTSGDERREAAMAGYIEHEKPSLCNGILIDFLTTDPAPTIAPIRRAA
jgi:hypothetical protein